MAKDRYQKTVKIPFIVQDGELRFFHDPKRKLELREGAIGDLVLNAENLLDEVWGAALAATAHVQIAHANTLVLLEMRIDRGAWALRTELLDKEGNEWNGGGAAYAPVMLIDPLYLRLRGEKHAKLSGCRCYLPTLKDAAGKAREAISLNQAFTFLSERYEPERQAHTGNVFEVVLIPRKGGFEALDKVRMRHTLAHETARQNMASEQQKLDFHS